MGMPVYQTHRQALNSVSVDWTMVPCVVTVGIALGTSATTASVHPR
jgi:hypothetical protein